MVCEADELPEEELAEARRELHVGKQAYEQDLERRRQELDADIARRLAAHQAEDEQRDEVQREERRRALLKGDEADTPEEHHVELTAAAEKPSREVIARQWWPMPQLTPWAMGGVSASSAPTLVHLWRVAVSHCCLHCPSAGMLVHPWRIALGGRQVHFSSGARLLGQSLHSPSPWPTPPIAAWATTVKR